MSMREPLYLDENATARPDLAAHEATRALLCAPPGNASSAHALGRRARGVIERARREVAQSLGVSPRHITFCSGATEALHMVILGRLTRGAHVIVSALEHPAVWGALELAQELLEIEVSVVEASPTGALSPARFADLVRPSTELVIAMAAQNELGLTYPVQRIAEAVAPAPLLSDCVQAWGKLPLSLEDTGASFATLSGHKIGAPVGVGLVWCRDGAPLRPLQRGGSQERGRRAGTEPVALIAGLGVAAGRAGARVEAMEALRAPRDELAERLSAHPRVLLNTGELYARAWEGWRSPGALPNTLSLRVRGLAGDLLLQALDLEGYCLSSGAACSSGALSPSPVLLALGLSEEEASAGLRLSLSPGTSREALLGFSERLLSLVDQLSA